jgi:hypothetical protein
MRFFVLRLIHLDVTVTNGSACTWYQWQSSPGLRKLTDINVNGTSANYLRPQPGATYYRVLVCVSTVARILYPMLVVEDQPTVSISWTMLWFAGGSSIISSNISTDQEYPYQWQTSPDGSTVDQYHSKWSSANYNVPTGIAGTAYRILVTTWAQLQ